MQQYKKYLKKILTQCKMLVKGIFTYFGLQKKNSSLTLSNKDRIFFIKRMSFLIKAGIPVSESLQMIREQTSTKHYTKIIDSIITDISQGKFLSTGLSKFKRAFGEFSINIIAVGETTGILSENLSYLADELQKRQILRRKIISAFVYPIVVTCATVGITSFLMIYLFPKIMPVFLSLHMELPLSTRIVLALSNFLVNFGWHTLISCILSVIVLFILIRNSETFHFYTDKYTLRIPIVGQIIQYYNLSSATRTIGLLLKGGIPLSEAIPITVKTTVNRVYREEYGKITKVINRGERMSVYLASQKKLFPDVFAQIVSVGERSGSLATSLLYLSDMYESEVDDFTKNLSNIIEPVMMIFMGLMVGFIAISIITPIYSITQNLHA